MLWVALITHSLTGWTVLILLRPCCFRYSSIRTRIGSRNRFSISIITIGIGLLILALGRYICIAVIGGKAVAVARSIVGGIRNGGIGRDIGIPIIRNNEGGIISIIGSSCIPIRSPVVDEWVIYKWVVVGSGSRSDLADLCVMVRRGN